MNLFELFKQKCGWSKAEAMKQRKSDLTKTIPTSLFGLSALEHHRLSKARTSSALAFFDILLQEK